MTLMHHKWLRPAIASALAISASLASAQENSVAPKPAKAGGSNIAPANDGGGKGEASKGIEPGAGRRLSAAGEEKLLRADPRLSFGAAARHSALCAQSGETYKEFEGIDWLNVGLDTRARFEYRKDDYRPWTNTTTNPWTSQRRNFPNSLWLSRTRAYVGVQNILDPFRFVVEFQDLRAYNSLYQLQGQEINQTDLIRRSENSISRTRLAKTIVATIGQSAFAPVAFIWSCSTGV